MPLLFLLLFVSITNTVSSSSPSYSSSCPLNFTILTLTHLDTKPTCQFIKQTIHLLDSDLLARTALFLPPITSAASCFTSYQSFIIAHFPNFNITAACGFVPSDFSSGCMNITTKDEFEAIVAGSVLKEVAERCNQTLGDGPSCASCTTELSVLQASYLSGSSEGNVTDCSVYASVYAAAVANVYGPTDPGTAQCLFSLDLEETDRKRRRMVLVWVIGGVGFGILRVNGGFGGSGRSLMKFSLDEIKAATRNFWVGNLIGKGGYGNVYKGVLVDGSEVAVKRFKNMSSAGEVDFAHEVEVIASIRHVNLMALVGYCVEMSPMEGCQRIIVCDLMKNGSLHDHLFGYLSHERKRLSWPTRQRIALGMARGLDYLHHGAQPAVIHRDIKASNILLDDRFEAKVCDFGLAKFTPEGASHLSTRVAGTMGYVSPEYALYGQLTDKSDVYSFGVVLLELLSGRNAIVSASGEGAQRSLVTDWAWSLVRRGRTLDVIEERMPEMGSPELMEKYVLVAVLCSHPLMYARPSMDQVMKILETNEFPVPSIPERPIPLIARVEDIESSVSSSRDGSGHLSTPVGYQSYTMATDYAEEERSFRS
ncbi:putative LRR receptor-like serine/threonine-protein kinase RKF3 [Drosera capensis]